MLPLLASRGWQKRFATLLYYRDYMVQVYLDNWTLHFQVGIDGDEFQNPDTYGDLDTKALIAFDAENGTRGIKPTDLRTLQKEIRAALLANDVSTKLDMDLEDAKQHHLVMETCPADDVEYAARRVVDYMDAIYDIARPILDRLNAAE